MTGHGLGFGCGAQGRASATGLLVAMSLAGSLAADEAAGAVAWEPVQTDGSAGIEVFRRLSPEGGSAEFKAVMRVAAPVGKVLEVIEDSDHFPEFLPHVKQAKVVRRDADQSWYVYERVNPTPLVSDRDYTLHMRHSGPDGEGKYVLEWSLANEAGPKQVAGVVRMRACAGRYDLAPADAGASTSLTYQVRIDPGGFIPPPIADLATRRSLPEVLGAIAARAMRQGR